MSRLAARAEVGVDLDTRKDKGPITSCHPRNNGRLLWINTLLPPQTGRATSAVVVGCCVGVPGWCQNVSRHMTLTLEWEGRVAKMSHLPETNTVLVFVISKIDYKNVHNCSMTHATFSGAVIVFSLLTMAPVVLTPPPHTTL